MKKYIIKNADGSKQYVMPAIHNTRKEALLTILRYTIKSVEASDNDCPTEDPINYIIHPVEEVDVNERITDFVSAISYLQAKGVLNNNTTRPCEVVNSLYPEYLKALTALNKLFTIAYAWNMMDEFVPNFSDPSQAKWYPWFEYRKNAAKFVCVNTHYTLINATTAPSFLLYFKTSERAKQFGEQFADLYNKVFL